MEHGLSAKSLRDEATATPKQISTRCRYPNRKRSQVKFCRLIQMPDRSIRINQHAWPMRWHTILVQRQGFGPRASLGCADAASSCLLPELRNPRRRHCGCCERIVFSPSKKTKPRRLSAQRAKNAAGKIYQSLAIVGILAALALVALTRCVRPVPMPLYNKLVQGRAEGATLLEQESTLAQFR